MSDNTQVLDSKSIASEEIQNALKSALKLYGPTGLARRTTGLGPHCYCNVLCGAPVSDSSLEVLRASLMKLNLIPVFF